MLENLILQLLNLYNRYGDMYVVTDDSFVPGCTLQISELEIVEQGGIPLLYIKNENSDMEV